MTALGPDTLPVVDGYVVDRELGGGGMSRVFVATETALARRVVVKVLGRELAQGLSAERFAREIALAAQLQDPHIVPVHATGTTAEGLPYFTMPFVEGESLRERLRAGAIPLDDALRLLRDVAEALEYAHARGVVHRDIKPENILLSGRSAVVADFGIAKAVSAAREPAANATLTSIGMSLGTPAYMSPEQAAGDPVDHRSDLYAWGMVAYEVLAGAHPFAHRTTMQQLMAAQLAEAPRPLDAARPGLPPALEAVVMRCLAKAPDERPESATALLAALGTAATDAAITSGRRPPIAAPASRTRAWVAVALGVVLVAGGGTWFVRRGSGEAANGAAAAAAASATPSLAVLPFEHQGDTAETYLTDGITDEIRNKLTGVSNLVVIARASSNRYKGKDVPPQQIAKELGVRWLLTGTVRVLGTGDQRRVLVRPELVEVTPDGRLQSKGGTPFDGAFADMVKAQGEVATQVVRSMEVAVGGEDRAKLVAVATTDPIAYDLYLRARAVTEIAADLPSLRAAASLVERALARDSTMVEGWAELTRLRARIYAQLSSPQAAEAARTASERAARLDPNGRSGLRARADHARLVLRDNGAALPLLRRVVELAPGDANALVDYAGLLASTGRHEAAIPLYEKAVRLDPRDPRPRRTFAYVLAQIGRLSEARGMASAAADLAPGTLGRTFATQLDIEFAAGDTAAVRRHIIRAASMVPPERLVAELLGTDAFYFLPPEQVRAYLARDPAETFDGDRAAWASTRADYAYVSGDSAAARAWGDTARRLVAARLQRDPDDGALRHMYANALAYVGRGQDAMREERAALAILRQRAPSSAGLERVRQLVLAASVATVAGDHDAAIAWLDELLRIRSPYTRAQLAIDPFFRALHGDPRFRALTGKP